MMPSNTISASVLAVKPEGFVSVVRLDQPA
jgi:hypothetical protein